MPEPIEPNAAPPKRRHRVRSPHPGVKLRAPKRALDDAGNPLFDDAGNAVWRGRVSYWRLVFVDPDTNAECADRIDPIAHPTKDARRDLAVRKSRTIAKRLDELADGAPRATGASFAAAFALFFENQAHLDPDTKQGYETLLNSFGAWAEKVGTTPDTLTKSMLLTGKNKCPGFRTWAFNLPKHSASKGGKRGERTKSSTPRSIPRVNTHIRVVRIALGWLHTTDRLPKIKYGDFEKALEQYDEPEIRPEFLSPAELRTLIKAALRHDADCFNLTRNERSRQGYKGEGSTPRYNPIAPLVVAAILTGMRLEELCIIEWRTHIFLDSLDINGDAVGHIGLRAQDVKGKKKPRDVMFDVSPALRTLIETLRRVNGSKGTVFGITLGEAEAALDRLRGDPDSETDRGYGAPDRFTWQMCRSTCSTFLVNSPGIYGGAAPYHESKQLGHSVRIAEKHYAGLIKGIKHEHRSLEAAMQIEPEVNEVIRAIGATSTKDNVVRLRA